MKLQIYQKAYFINQCQKFPNLTYDDISLNLIKDYECDIIYSPKQFSNYKQLLYKEKKQEITTDKLLEQIDYYDENLLKVDYKFLNNENKFDIIKIYGTYISLNLLNDKKINQYFIEGTYKVVPYNKEYKCMVVLMGFNYSLNLYQLILVALLSNETGDIYTKFYNILIENYKFSPKFISCDFGLGNLKGFKNVYGDSGTKIITCFFHLSQAWWKKANSLGLRKKIYIKDTRVLIFNLQRLAFLNYDNGIKLYKKIKSRKEYKDIENYLDFFDYFEKNWFPVNDKKNKIIQSSTYEFNLWNYYNKLEYEGPKAIYY